MPRTKKKVKSIVKTTQQNTTRYRTALYLRLSREDGDKTESDSIANQRTLLEAYAIDHPELCIVDEFVDDGYSGSNFERPAFQRLFQELEQGTINCILVKDLSRFGRNYIEVGRYLERIFPVMRVRLIAVTDNYDSQSAWKTSDSIMVPMRNLLNDAYCRDISVKIKSQLAVKRKRGDFVGSFATYGYQNHRDDLMLLDVFADKRCTGTNFDRPEFERLLKALQERKVNCIVVKDFSRLGRNFVETGQYLEQVFPLFGVRFIAINDNYDSLNRQSRDGMLVPIKSMINEMYSKDLSQKIQSCFRSKEARGEIYTPVPFGYKRNQQNHLILDEEVSDVVVRIFLWKKSGMKEREIAKKLSAQGIPTPFTRRCQLGYLKNTLRVKDPVWQTVFVTKVLENPIYTGTMVYNRIAYDETNRKIGQNPRESWRMVPDSHPAIISWELFDEVSALREAEQAVKEERKKWCRQRRKNNPNIFKGRIFCKKCGEKLVCHWQSDGTLYFYCASCHISISEKDLWNGINKELHQRMEEHRDLQKLVRKSSGKSKLQSKEIATKREIEQASGNIVRLESQKRSGYEQYVLGKISKEKFLELKQDVENEIEAFRQTKAENEKELVVVQEELQQKKQNAGNTEVLLTADNLQQYVKKIEVDHKKNTYTEFAF